LGLVFAGTVETKVNKMAAEMTTGYRIAIYFGAGLAAVALLFDASSVRMKRDVKKAGKIWMIRVRKMKESHEEDLVQPLPMHDWKVIRIKGNQNDIVDVAMTGTVLFARFHMQILGLIQGNRK
jgi:hypothetical protein